MPLVFRLEISEFKNSIIKLKIVEIVQSLGTFQLHREIGQ